MDLASRESGCPDQLVNIDRTWAQRADDPLTLARADVGEWLTVRSSSPRRRARLALGAGAGLVLAFANARLLASHEPADIVGVPNIKKNREQQEQRSESPLPRQREHA